MAVLNVIKGFFIGIALVIPGLSGSIFAVVVGLYDKIIDSVSNFTKDIKKAVVFLGPIAIGVAAGILASTKAVLWICESYPVQSYLFFTGLVLGSVPLIFRKMRKTAFKAQYIIISILSFFCIMALTRLGAGGDGSYVAIESMNTVQDGLTMAFAGVFSVSLMAIPGVSGSVMLMIINQYGTVYNAVGKAVDFMSYIIQGDTARAIASLKTVLLIAPFLLGALIGLIVIAKIMAYLLKEFEALVYYAVAGIVAAAVAALLSEGFSGSAGADLSPAYIFTCLTCLAAGICGTVFLDTPSDK